VRFNDKDFTGEELQVKFLRILQKALLA
jgi:hypothetical protein